MLDYLNKFNSLPQYLKDKMSDPSILAAIKELEEKYDISLAAVVMKVMVKDISILDLAQYFVFEYRLDGKKAETLVEEMKEKVLFVSADYLGFETKTKRDLLGVEQKPGQIVNKVKTSNFFFSSEDEEEVLQLTKTLGPKDEVKEVNDERINSIVDEVVFETGVSFSSGDLSERFVKVLKTYARGVRNKIDIKITLSKDVDKGGLGMSNERAEEVLKSLDKRNKKAEQKLPEIKLKDDSLEGNTGGGIPEKKNDVDNFRKKMEIKGIEPQRDMEYDLSSMPKKTPTTQPPGGFAGQASLEKPVPMLDSKGLPIPVPVAKNGEQIKSTDIKAPTLPVGELKGQTPMKAPIKIENKNLDDRIAGTDGKFKSRISAPETGRKKVEDVKVVPKLSGPIDELRHMNIVDFRRLDPDPMRAAAKIKEKIGLLEEDGFRKRLEGIRAWRESRINNEYIEIGRRSIGQKKPVNEIIHDKNISGQDTLREDEFEAILNLNREIRY
ncbi:MAG: hypothetical protein PF572_05220 [Patescibacteria group bacterium]|jgi:hypothetical protein|nr:hypothetical protein [Patescibacteria group bacterium]